MHSRRPVPGVSSSTHRPCELPTPDEYELAHDGLELDV